MNALIRRPSPACPRVLCRHLLSLLALAFLAGDATAAPVCTIRLLGRNYDLYYAQPSGGIYPSFNALSERVDYDLEEFGIVRASTAAGVLGGKTAGTFGIHLGQSPLDPDRDVGNVRSEAEDISPDGRFVIGWRQERPGFSGGPPPRAFLYSNEDGFRFLDEIFPAVKELATRPYPTAGGHVHGSKGLAINDAGLMVLESVPDPAAGSPSGHYLVTRDGQIMGILPRGGIDLNASGQMPGPGMSVINDRGQQALATDINNQGFQGDPTGFVVTPSGERVNLIEAILGQCNNEVIRRELSGSAGTRPVFINDAGEILFGHLFLSPSCPSVSFSATGEAGFEFINGKVSVRFGNRIAVRTTVRNTGQGLLENIRIEAPDLPRHFRRVGHPSPPIPATLLPGESVVSVSEWEAAEVGEYFGVTTLYAEGPCGPIAEPLPPARIVVVEQIPVIEVTAPAADELVHRGEPYTIRFKAPEGVKAVDLFLVRTRNPNGPRTLLAQGVPADVGQYLWEVPEDMETPSTFLVAVDAGDPTQEGVSRRFRVRQRWRLHRIMGTFNEPKYERINTLEHIWSFDQTDENMWPEAYWDRPQHDYRNIEAGFDPFIGPDVRYDPELFGEHIAPEWPAWPALVRAFGTGGSYASLEPWTFQGIRMHQPNRDAADHWHSQLLLDSQYNGVCYGLSMSLMAAFQDPERFDAKWLPGGGSRELAQLLPSTPGVRDAAHALQLYTWGRLDESDRYRNATQMTPRDVVDRLKAMFENDDRDRDRFLVIDGYVDEFDDNGDQVSAAHAIVPLGMTNLDETTYRIAVYDPNSGSEGAFGLFVDVADNRWWHSDTYWLGDTGKGLYLSGEAIRAFELASSTWPHVLEGEPLPPNIGRAKESAEPLSIQIAGRAGAVLSGTGELRYERGTLTRTLPGGFVSFPITGRPSHPDKYLVPAGAQYRVEALPRADGLVMVRVSGGAVTSTLRQTGADSAMRLEAELFDEGLSIVRGGAGRFELAARTLADSGEFRSIRILALTASDPAGLRLAAAGEGFQLAGPAGASTYHLELGHSGFGGRRVFHRAEVPLAAGATHTFRPDWATLGDVAVSIAVDRDGDGQADETMVVENQAPSPVLWPGWAGGASRLRIEVRVSSEGIPEFRVAVPSTGTFQVEWSPDAVHWTGAGTATAGVWLPVISLPGLPSNSAGPLFVRVRE